MAWPERSFGAGRIAAEPVPPTNRVAARSTLRSQSELQMGCYSHSAVTPSSAKFKPCVYRVLFPRRTARPAQSQPLAGRKTLIEPGIPQCQELDVYATVWLP